MNPREGPQDSSTPIFISFPRLVIDSNRRWKEREIKIKGEKIPGEKRSGINKIK